MRQYKSKIIVLLIAVLSSFMLPFLVVSAHNELSFTAEELAYIAQKKVVRAVTVDGVAPLQYADSKGEVQGISKKVMDRISQLTGLDFVYELHPSVAESLWADADILFGIPYHYAPDDMVMTEPFLYSKTIIYMNKSVVDAEHLENKIYAAVRGSDLPEGVPKDHALYFDSREESLDAVNSGAADYGFGNAYSVVYYNQIKKYQNIITIPKEKEPRAYCIGLKHDDPLLLSILNKAIAAISEDEMQTIILDAALAVETKVTLDLLLSSFGKELLAIVACIILILILSMIANIRSNEKLSMQIRKYELLAQIANEFLYEYDRKHDRLELSEKCRTLFGGHTDEAVKLIKLQLLEAISYEHSFVLRLPLADGTIGIFRAVNSRISDDRGKMDTVIGKLTNISQEAAEKAELVSKAQIDGLTGLLNPATVKARIMQVLANKDNQTLDAFLMIDCDKFKEINDTLGHLQGDRVLAQIGRALQRTFRDSDITGRFGGDEFCVYLKDIPSELFATQKCQQLTDEIQRTNEGIPVTVSIGVAILKQKQEYDVLFQCADRALYIAKRKGGGTIEIAENCDFESFL